MLDRELRRRIAVARCRCDCPRNRRPRCKMLCRHSAKLPDLADDGLHSQNGATTTGTLISSSPARTIAACCTARSRCCARSRCTSRSMTLDVREEPYAPIRILNHWDNLDGTIERGYAGKSIFWENGHVASDLEPRPRLRPADGVGRHQRLLDQQRERRRARRSRRSTCRRSRGSPTSSARGACGCSSRSTLPARAKIGGIETFDPLDPQAVAFWKRNGRRSLSRDSRPGRLRAQGRFRRPARPVRVWPHATPTRPTSSPGPSSRTAASCSIAASSTTTKWTGAISKNDRATAAYNNFHKLDGLFEDNVIIQIKHGPIDFQVREPPSPLFGGLEKTNQAIELQITQEYLGQQRHLCYIVPMWKEVLDFDMQARGAGTPVKQLVAGSTFRAAARRIRRRVERGPRRELARPSPGDGESLRLRPAGVESGPVERHNRRGVDAADVRPRLRWSSKRSSTCCCARGRSTKATPARSASARSPTSFTSTSARRRSRRSTTAGGSGTARTRPASAWTARSPPAPASSANIVRPSPRCSNRSKPARTTCCCSCTMCRTRTGCETARR